MNKLYIILCLFLASCINNNIPYPYIHGEVVAFEATGQASVTIDKEKQTITLTLGEDTDPRAVQITKLGLNENATSTLDISKPLDLTKTIDFTIETYQKYEWKLITTQPIAHKIRIANQVGEATVDAITKTIKIGVGKSQELNAIKVMEFKIAPKSAIYAPNPLTITDFTTPVKLVVTCWGVTEQWTVTVERLNVVVFTLAPNPWGKFAYLNGSIIENSTDPVSFEYRTKSATEWQSIPATVQGTSISAKLTGLIQETQYVYRARLGNDFGSEVEFTTDATPDVPNMNMDTWTLDNEGKNWYANDVAADSFWATGNEGVTSTLAGSKPSNSAPTNDSHSGKAARLESIKVSAVGMAAGNLFTGNFIMNPLKPLDSPGFSRPYTGRPTSMSFWYKYSPKPLNSQKTPADIIGQTDKCTVYIILGTWEGELKSSKIKGLETEGAIAYGVFTSDETVTQYTKKTIEIRYKDMVTRPTHMMIVSSSSLRGEEYIGGIGSTLFLDDIEFGWE